MHETRPLACFALRKSPSRAEIGEADAFILPVTFLRFATQTNKKAPQCQPSPVRMERHGGKVSHPIERRVLGSRPSTFVRRSKVGSQSQRFDARGCYPEVGLPRSAEVPPRHGHRWRHGHGRSQSRRIGYSCPHHPCWNKIQRPCQEPFQHHRETKFVRRRHALQQFLRIRYRQERPREKFEKLQHIELDCFRRRRGGQAAQVHHGRNPQARLARRAHLPPSLRGSLVHCGSLDWFFLQQSREARRTHPQGTIRCFPELL